VEALRPLTAVLAQPVQGAAVLDAFGNELHAEVVRQVDRSRDNRGIGAVGWQVAHEGAVDISVRYEWFELEPYNDPQGFTNIDEGNVLAVSWLFQATPAIRAGLEYLSIASDHCSAAACAWTWQGLPRSTREESLQLTLRWGFSGAF